MTSGLVPMLSPDGQSGDIPAERVNDAMAAGFKKAVVMTAPNGQMGYVPHDRANDAINAGFKVGQPAAQEQSPEQAGFGERVGNAYGLTKENIGQAPPKPSVGDVLVPGYSGLKMLYQTGKAAYDNLRGAGKENAEAVANIAQGQPILPNVGKAIAGDVEAGLKTVAPSVQNLGEDVYDKNYRGAAGDVAGALSQAALAKPGDVAAVPGKIAEAIPSAARAGANFQEVMGAAKNSPVHVTDALSDSLMNYQKLVDAGGSRSLAVNKLLQRLTNPDKGPLTYEEARDFSSNISRLSADEQMRLTKPMKRVVGQISNDLNDAVENTAAQAGKLPQFQSAMDEYHKAMVMRKYGAKALDYGIKGALGYAGAKAIKDIMNP